MWFVPFDIGLEPILIGGSGENAKRCFRMWCNCAGDIGPDVEQESYCEVQTSAGGHIGCSTLGGLHCGDDVNRGCIGFATIELCNNIHPGHPDSLIALSVYNGGVFVEGEKISIREPAWYKQNANSKLFVQTEAGSVYVKEEYDAWQAKLKKENKEH